MRLHPAESRIRKLSRDTPAHLMVFDILYAPDAGSLLAEPLAERRAALDRFRATAGAGPMLRLSPCTRKRGEAERWLEVVGDAIDGVVAKRLDGVYVPGERGDGSAPGRERGGHQVSITGGA